jgi:hypothetical protein
MLFGDFIGKAVTAEAGVTDSISKPRPSMSRFISSTRLRRAATIKASATVPAEISNSG